MPNTAQQYLAFGPFVLDRLRRSLTRDGVPVVTGGRAYEVFDVLAGAAGETVGKHVLIDLVWPGLAVEENNLQVQISALRKALGSESIVTVPGRGYRLTLPISNAEPLLHDDGADDKPSIAILPFVNLSAGVEQEYFAEGIAEEITTALSRIRWLSIIARTSAFSYKGRAVDVRQVGRELGARYVLEGSVRKAGSRIRITGQLIEAATGTHLWAERYEGSENVFDLQDRVTARMVAAIQPKLFAAEAKRADSRNVKHLQAYELVMRALPLYYSRTRDGVERAEQLLRKAIGIDRAYAPALAALAMRHWVTVSQGWVDRDDPAVAGMVELAETALALASGDPIIVHVAAVITALPGGDLSAGITLIDLSIKLNPNDAVTFEHAAMLLAYEGNTSTAFSYLEESARLNPFGQTNYVRALTHFVAGEHKMVVEAATSLLRENRNHVPALRYLGASLGLLDRLEEGRQVGQRLLALTPDFTIVRARRHVEFNMNHAFRTPGVAASLYEGLRQCGIPDS